MEKNTYEKLIELVPGIAIGMDQIDVNNSIIIEILRLREEIRVRDIALQYMTNGMSGGSSSNEDPST